MTFLSANPRRFETNARYFSAATWSASRTVICGTESQPLVLPPVTKRIDSRYLIAGSRSSGDRGLCGQDRSSDSVGDEKREDRIFPRLSAVGPRNASAIAAIHPFRKRSANFTTRLFARACESHVAKRSTHYTLSSL